MRYLLDESLPPRAATELRALGIDAVSVHEIGRRGASDRSLLACAADERRCLITQNVGDFLAFQDTGAIVSGLLLVSWQVRRSDVPLLVAYVAEFDQANPAGLGRNESRWLRSPPPRR